MDDSRKRWAEIIGEVKNPLGFFTLALLIVESSLTAIALFSDLSDAVVTGIVAAIGGIFLSMVGLVAWFARNAAGSLYEIERQRAQLDALQQILQSQAYRDYLNPSCDLWNCTSTAVFLFWRVV